MNTRSKRSSLRSEMSRSFGSKAWASTPRSRNAPSTALPDSSDISLSAERPPMSTATFPKRSPLIPSLSFFTHDLDFTLQHHLRIALYRLLHEYDELLDVVRGRAAFVDDEIGMHSRNLRAAHASALQAACLDKTGCVVAGWIAEYRAGVGLG